MPWDDFDEEVDDLAGGRYARINCKALRFNSDSAVVLPEGLRVLQGVLAYAGDHPDERLLILSHTDSQADADYNQELSDERALNVLNLLRDDGKEPWIRTCADRHRVRDVHTILKWADGGPEWNCDPGPLAAPSVKVLDQRTKKALVAFKEAYRVNVLNSSPKPLSPAEEQAEQARIGDTPPNGFWNMVYNLYLMRLRAYLGGLTAEAYRERCRTLQFVDRELPSRGCGERYPLEGAGQDGLPSETNRRTEFMFFPREARVPVEDLRPLYDPERYEVEDVPCPEAPDPRIRLEPPKGDFVVLLDISGSMRKDDGLPESRFERAKSAVYELLRAKQGTGCTFNVWVFSTNVRPWESPHMKPCDAAHVEQAIAWVRDLQAIGGTNTRDAFEVFTRFAHPKFTVVFVSDGMPNKVEGDLHREMTLAELNALKREITGWARDPNRGFDVHTYGFVLVEGDRMSSFMKYLATPPQSRNWHPISSIPVEER